MNWRIAMKNRWMNLIWGLILIVGGGLYLARNMGYITEPKPVFWSFIFAGLSLLFFASYFINGVQNWGWLFPALIFAALALTVGMALSGVDDPAMGAPILASVGIPFLVAFALKPRERWWALIPAWVMILLTLITVVVDRVPGEVIGSIFLFAIGLPFLVVYLVNRTRLWALIPGIIMVVLSVIPVLAISAPGEYIGAFVLLGIAIPFYIIYFRSVKNWWALIPAGVLTSVAIIPPLSLAFKINSSMEGVLRGILWLGIAITFLVLWLRRAVQPTGWAVYVAGGAGVVAVISFLLSGKGDIAGSVFLILVGAGILFLALRPKTKLTP